MISVKVLTRDNWSQYSSGLQELENLAEYPYGLDTFKITHGESYFSFFERLGEPLFHIVLDGTKIIACGAGVLRSVPQSQGLLQSWYLCDLKVHPEYRGQRLAVKMFKKNLLLNYFRCPRAYAVSMNPPGKVNRVAKITERFPLVPIKIATELNIFGLTYDQMISSTADISHVVGPTSFLSLAGKKDLVMSSTGAPLRILHLQHGPMAETGSANPQPGAVHMICAPVRSNLDQLLCKRFEPSATASVLAHGMSKADWNFILTSEI